MQLVDRLNEKIWPLENDHDQAEPDAEEAPRQTFHFTYDGEPSERFRLVILPLMR